MADVFISYHRSEGTSALVRRIADELESIGISCWYDSKDPPAGYFVQMIKQKILSCKVFLLIWDEGANNSEWCLSETYTAFNGMNHAVRIPFQLGNFTKHVEMEFYMTRCQIFVGGDSPENANIKKLVAKIAALFGKTPAKIIKRDSCGANVTYALGDNGVLTISGKGDMKNMWQKPDTPWANERKLICVAKIQKGVTSVGYGAFYKCGNLKSLLIPDSVTSIGICALAHCNSLTSLTIPDGVTSIEYSSFKGCRNLTSIVIPDSMVSIKGFAFLNCNSLTSVSVPKMCEIADNAFPENTTVIRRE